VSFNISDVVFEPDFAGGHNIGLFGVKFRRRDFG
jgi:hypothetical protein